MSHFCSFVKKVEVPRLPLLLLLLVTSLVVYLSFFGLSVSSKLRLFISVAYYAVAISFLCALVFSIKPLFASVTRVAWTRIDLAAFLVLFGVMTTFFAFEKNEYKVVMDEIILLSTSMGLYETAEPEYPVYGYWHRDRFQPGLMEIDKRPILFPFLTAMLHSIRGYSVENPFLLNTLLSLVLLPVLYCVARKLAPTLPSFIGVLLFICIPEYVITGNGAGFGVLNLLIILWVFLAAIAYLEDNSVQTLNALIFSGVLLSFVRPESVLYIVAVCFVVLVGVVQQKRLALSYWAVLVPVLVSFYVFQKDIFELRPGLWQEMGQDGLLNISYFKDNLYLNLMYFFNFGYHSSNSIALSCAGLIAIFGLFRVLQVRSLRLPKSPGVIVLACFFLVVCLQFTLFQFYYGGDVYKWTRSRYTLPLCLLLCLLVSLFLAQPLPKRRWFCVILLLAIGVEGLGFNFWAVVQERRVKYAFVENWKQTFADTHVDEKYLVIGDHESALWAVNQQSTVPYTIAKKWLPQLKFLFEIGYFDAIYYYHPPYRGNDPRVVEAIEILDSVLEVAPLASGQSGEVTVMSIVTAVHVDGVQAMPSERVRYDSPLIEENVEINQRILDSFPYWRVN